MKITNQNYFEHALASGFNLFIGAGFSTLAKDKCGRCLPLGNALRDELAEMFNKPRTFSLSQLSTIIESIDKSRFYQYLTDRFTVEEYDQRYLILNKLGIKSVFTTNIDNLIPRIVKNSKLRYINNQCLNGPSEDSYAINYMPLHGYVEQEPHKYIFDVASIANVYNDATRLFSYLAREVEIRPTLFLGYGFSDSSVIQALTNHQTFNNAKKEMWILLCENDVQYAEYFESMGFSIIEGNIEEFLDYLSDLSFTRQKKTIDEERRKYLLPYCVPRSIQDVKVQRPIKEFYLGSSPSWCDIINNQIYKTHYYNIVNNYIYENGKNVIIIGSPISGKSTLLMQLAYFIQYEGLKFFFDKISLERAEFITKMIGSDNAIVFIDNLADSIEALHVLEKSKMKIVAAERSHNFSIISHLINDSYNIVNITQLSERDQQGIYNALPSSIRNENLRTEKELSIYGKDSLFEFVIRNISYPNIRERYKDAIQKLEKDDADLAEFIVLCAYMHNCHVPLSFEMAYDYFTELYPNISYSDIFELKSDSDDIIKDYIPNDNNVLYKDMDYYYPRSRYAAEVILDSCSIELLQMVLNNVLQNIGSYRICNYSIYRKYAFDKRIVSRAFPNWNEGKLFYESAFIYDNNNPYVLQQGALYLAQRYQYDIAFEWIDRAINMTDDKYFSIRNTHAIILFNANINKNDINARNELDKSMNILEKCMNADNRKRFHAITYGRHAIQYYLKYTDDKALTYMYQAKNWLSEEIDHSAWDIDAKQIYEQIISLIPN